MACNIDSGAAPEIEMPYTPVVVRGRATRS